MNTAKAVANFFSKGNQVLVFLLGAPMGTRPVGALEQAWQLDQAGRRVRHGIKPQANSGAIGFLLLMISLSARAQLPQATFYETAEGVGDSHAPGVWYESASIGNGTSTITQGTDPYVAAEANGASTYPDLGGYATTQYIYYFEVTGVTGDVPVWVSTSGEATRGAITGFSADASIQIGGFSETAELTSGSGTSLETSFSSPTNALTLTAGTEYDVVLTASASVYGTGNAEAWVDPQLYIDPTYAAENPDASLEFSPNFSPAPEPSAMGLFGAGLLGLFVVRQKLACAGDKASSSYSVE